ncbi:TPA: hypothetical protein HA244_02630 [Candidatus Micrarchaeota archaeon]|nr:hypothetical protein [Candidatus Micrarchaeota archaeon]
MGRRLIEHPAINYLADHYATADLKRAEHPIIHSRLYYADRTKLRGDHFLVFSVPEGLMRTFQNHVDRSISMLGRLLPTPYSKSRPYGELDDRRVEFRFKDTRRNHKLFSAFAALAKRVEVEPSFKDVRPFVSVDAVKARAPWHPR